MNANCPTPRPQAGRPDPLIAENDRLRARLEEAEEALRAIRSGEVDALVLPGPNGEEVFTLKTADHAFRLLVEGVQEGAVVVADDGSIVYANRCFAEMLDRPLEQIVGHPVAEWAGERDRSRLDGLSREARAGTARFECELKALDESAVPVYLSASSIQMDDRPVLCLVVSDLRDRKRTEEVLEADRAKDRFLAALSHELRTPLNPVMATVQLMEMDPALPPGQRESLQMIRRNVELEVRLIDDLLDLTKVVRGKVELHCETVDVHAAMKSALDINQSEIAGKQLVVSLSLWAERHHAFADPARVQQVFWNLLKNAVKFTPRFGRIDIRSTNFDQRLRIEVSDSGIGIAPAVLERLFHAFEQGDRAIRQRFGGLGLGLSIARALAEMHGGTLVGASGGVGQGSTFTLELPTIEPAAPVARTSMESGSPLQGRSCRILLVEDHKDTVKVMAHLLRRAGYVVKAAGNVAEALAEAESGSFDLLISDIGLPDGTGNELMQQVHRRFNLKGIAVSGFGTEEDVRLSREAGFADHVVKPINFAVLQSIIQRLTVAG